MNPRYKNGILLLGAIAPALVIALALGFSVSKRTKITEEYDNRIKIQQANIQVEKAAEGVKIRLEFYQDRKAHWDNLLKTSDARSVTGLLKEIANKYSGGEKFRQNDFNFINRSTGIGAASKQPSVTYNISLSGTYQALQESLLSLESQMPNLSLNSIALKPQSSGQLLEAEISYSAWIK